MKFSKGWGAVLIVMLLLLLDQALKIWIKTHLQLHESHSRILSKVQIKPRGNLYTLLRIREWLSELK